MFLSEYRSFLRNCLLGCLLLLAACIPRENVLILDYESFGPPVMAHELLGSPWWQWLSHGDSNPETQYAIKVLVHKEATYQPIKNYQVSESEQQDYRYVSCQDAWRYLTESIAMVREINDVVMLKRLTQVADDVRSFCGDSLVI